MKAIGSTVGHRIRGATQRELYVTWELDVNALITVLEGTGKETRPIGGQIADETRRSVRAATLLDT